MKLRRFLTRISKFRLLGAAAAFAAFALTAATPPENEPASTGGPLNVRRLSADQYRLSIADIFGPDIKVEGRFEGEVRAEGLGAIGSSQATISPTGAEYYVELARKIAAQVVDAEHRKRTVPCAPADPKAFDQACATQFVANYGRQLFRRPLSAQEVAERVKLSAAAATKLGNFHSGLQFALVSMLSSPRFLFVMEQSRDGQIDAYSKAARLSFLFWNSTPDKSLLDAAATGRLDTPEGLSEQVERLTVSPRYEVGVRAFFSDMLNLGVYDMLTKDGEIYPTFTRNVLQSSKEEMLRTLVDLLVEQDGDYRDIFTTRQSFINRDLGYHYGVPVESENGWQKISFDENSHRAGLLTSVGFLALHSHPGRSSATLRGAAVRELLLCQGVPPPPGDVDFTLLQDTKNPNLRTARDRLKAHVTAPACAGCHKLMDPIGLPLENFDGGGRYRTTENDAPIDPSGEYNGKAFTTPAELGQMLHDDPQVSKCLVNRVFGYSTGRAPARGERRWVGYLQNSFAMGGYKFNDFLRRLANNPNFYRVDMGIANPRIAQAITETKRTGS